VPSNHSFPGDCRYSIQRRATGSKDLKAEESTNTSIGVVIEPIQNLTITLDYWAIEKEDTIGLFGEENHLLVDLVLRLDAGTSNCAGVVGNPAVSRSTDTSSLTQAEVDGFLAAGLCPMGTALFVSDQYANLDTRTVEGYDIGVYYDVDTRIGDFSFRYNGSFYDKYQQDATSGISAFLAAEKAANPAIVYPTMGLGDLLSKNGNQEKREAASLSWRKSDFGASVSMYRIGAFFQELSTGDIWDVPAMTTYSASVDYSFDIGKTDTRVRLGVSNLTDERAPLYDDSFGFSSDAHTDWGRSYYLDLRMQF
jgi:outer membrane receptor protein involved in Fe transport